MGNFSEFCFKLRVAHLVDVYRFSERLELLGSRITDVFGTPPADYDCGVNKVAHLFDRFWIDAYTPTVIVSPSHNSLLTGGEPHNHNFGRIRIRMVISFKYTLLNCGDFLLKN
jgi:hypothetical protein